MSEEISGVDNYDTKENDELFDELNLEEINCKKIDKTIKKEKSTFKGTEDDMLLSAIANSFPQEQKLNEKLKKIFSYGLLAALSVLIIAIVCIVILMGAGILKYNEWTIRLFITGVFIEIVGIVQIMVSSLFPKEDRKNYLDFLDRCTHHKHEKE